MKLKTILLGAAALACLAGPAFAQDAVSTAAPADSSKKHHHHANTLEERLDRMERIIQEQQGEIRDLKAQTGQANGGASATAAGAPPQPQPEVSAAQFEALQNQIYEQAAENKSHAVVTLKKGRPTIATPDGK